MVGPVISIRTDETTLAIPSCGDSEGTVNGGVGAVVSDWGNLP